MLISQYSPECNQIQLTEKFKKNLKKKTAISRQKDRFIIHYEKQFQMEVVLTEPQHEDRGKICIGVHHQKHLKISQLGPRREKQPRLLKL